VAFEPQFTGRWVTSKGNVHFIGLEAIQWSNGDVSQFHSQRRWGRPSTCTMQVRGKRVSGELRPDDTLAWSDGDIWLRDTRRAETRTKEVLVNVGYTLAEYVDHYDLSALAPGCEAGGCRARKGGPAGQVQRQRSTGRAETAMQDTNNDKAARVCDVVFNNGYAPSVPPVQPMCESTGDCSSTRVPSSSPRSQTSSRLISHGLTWS